MGPIQGFLVVTLAKAEIMRGFVTLMAGSMRRDSNHADGVVAGCALVGKWFERAPEPAVWRSPKDGRREAFPKGAFPAK